MATGGHQPDHRNGGNAAAWKDPMMVTSVLDAPENPFALDVVIIPEAVGTAGRSCNTDDGCDPTCASSCTSSSC
jgi:FxLD family lantipeptide